MTSKNEIILSYSKIKEAIDNTPTMGGAAKYLKIDWRTFKKEADKHGLYKPSVGGGKYELTDILNGEHPQYPTSKLIPRLVKEGYKEYKCECCGNNGTYNNKKLSLELDHIDGDNSNHSLNNLRILCPNCHSQTDTYRSKKLKFNKAE